MAPSSPPPGSKSATGQRADAGAPHLRVHTVSVYVRDQEKSLRFFVDQLGFEVAFDAQLQSGERWVAVAPPHGGALLALIAPKPQSNQYKLIGRNTGILLVTDNVVAKYAEWSKRGVEFHYAPRLRRVKYDRSALTPSPDPAAGLEEHDQVWGGVFTRFKDLDGNAFSLAGFDEVTREIERQRRATAERLEAEHRAAQELEIAKQVQARLFPQTLPPIETLECAGTCIQARQVGGDYFDFLDLGEGRFGLVVGDIAGKGMAAALLMANLQANVRIHCGTRLHHPQTLLQSVNRVFHTNTSESAYATLFFAEYEEEGRRLRYANCGHLPALLLRNDGTLEHLESTATVLGLFKEFDCPIEERSLSPGDTLALYTDGITESFNPAGQDFGEERLISALRRHRNLPPQSIISAIVDEVQRFSDGHQFDDITLTIAKCR
jgi:serine phosphatase RsbU (regulator of sigma subunit)